MIPFHSILPELAQREVRCIHLGAVPNGQPDTGLSAGEYAYVEFYCPDLECDCRRVFIQVIARHEQDRVLASINYGWEKESFYRKRLPWDPDAPRQIVRGSLDPMNEQSEHAPEMLELFQKFVLDEPYRLRLRRHYQLFREELAHRKRPPDPPRAGTGGPDAGSQDRAGQGGPQRPRHQETFPPLA